MYLTPSEKHWVFDIEADGLKPTKVWIVTFKNAITKERHSFTEYEKIKSFIEDRSRNGCVFVGHNIISYDAPVLNRLIGSRLGIGRLVDTFLLSMLYSPSLAGGHSLDAWGDRIGIKKLGHDEWDRYSEEMKQRNLRDVDINLEMYLRLTKRMRDVGFSERGCEIEHRAWNIIQNKQRKRGFHFNIDKAKQLFVELGKEEEQIREQIYHQFPPKLLHVKTYRQHSKADGTPTRSYETHLQQFEQLELRPDGGYDAFDFVEFNLGSPKQRVEKLLELGWKPEEFTEKGTPQPTRKGELSPSLAAFAEESGIKEIKMIAEWLAVNGRSNSINNWMELYNPDTGGIHGQLWMAATLRYRHDNPNTANIPSVRVDKENQPLRGRSGFWTYEARDLWTTRDPRTRNLIGIDAVAIQFRVLAEALGDEEFKKVVLGGDVHEYNRSKTGYGTRGQNKTFGYAALLGAGAAKTGSIFGVDAKTGGKIKKNWIKTVPGLSALYERLESELRQTGRISLCDGSRVLVSSPHMVLAYLLQGDESRIMKQAMILVDEYVRKEGLDVDKVGDIHDEWQSDGAMADTGRYIDICKRAFPEAGRSFNYDIPIDCSDKVGKTWAETH